MWLRRLLFGLIALILSTSPVWATETQKAAYSEQLLQTAAVAVGPGSLLAVDRYTAVGVDVNIATTATITFEGSVEGTLAYSVSCINTATGASSATATVSGTYQCNVAGLKAFRARISSWTAGAVTVYARATTAIIGGASSGAGGSTPTLSGCWSTVAAPTYSEGILNPLSCTLSGALRADLVSLLFGEDYLNSAFATEGSAVRGTVGNVASGLLIAADCTSHCTPAAYVALPTGSKTFTSTIVSATSGDTVVAQTHKIYGGNTASFTSDDAVLLCTNTFTAATQYLTKKFTQSCTPVTGSWLYYGVISSATGSGAGVVTGDVTATY